MLQQHALLSVLSCPQRTPGTQPLAAYFPHLTGCLEALLPDFLLECLGRLLAAQRHAAGWHTDRELEGFLLLLQGFGLLLECF